jgi:diguanylate cyclase (GGDEF)-like protein
MVAREAGLQDADEAFLGGLLHGIGVLALLQSVGDPYVELIASAGGSYRRMLALEADQFGFDHTMVGGELLTSWKLPESLSAAVRFQRTADFAPENVRRVARAVATGISVADVATGGTPGESLAEFHLRCQGWFGLDHERADELLERVLANEEEMRSLFDVPKSSAWEVEEILARANEALVQLSLETNEENQRLHTVAAGLAEEASTDALTGVANRRALEQQLAAQFEAAHKFGAPVSFLMVDIDHFKKVNDEHGHHVGDRLLEMVAQSARAALRRGDFLARYGGEEFAVLLPGAGLRAAAEVAERIRQEVERLRMVSATGTISVTVSIGVAEIGGWHASAGAVIEDADQALYAAKQGGRNQIAVSWGLRQAA